MTRGWGLNFQVLLKFKCRLWMLQSRKLWTFSTFACDISENGSLNVSSLNLLKVFRPVRKIFLWILHVLFERVKIAGVHSTCYCWHGRRWKCPVCHPPPVKSCEPYIVPQDLQRRSLCWGKTTTLTDNFRCRSSDIVWKENPTDSFQYFRIHLCGISLVIEGWSSSEKLKHQNTNWPDVSTIVVALISDDLWCNILGGPTECPCFPLNTELLGKTKVCQLYVSITVKEKILWF